VSAELTGKHLPINSSTWLLACHIQNHACSMSQQTVDLMLGSVMVLYTSCVSGSVEAAVLIPMGW